MILQASPFSLNCGSHLVESIGDMTAYGHKDVKMAVEGYDAVRASLASSDSLIETPPVGLEEARAAVARHFQGQNFPLTSDDVILTHGGNIGLFAAILALCDEGDNIAIPEPSYPFYQKVSVALGVQARVYSLRPEAKWEIDLAHLESLIDERTKFIWIVNPSNPCGSIFSKQHILDVLALARRKGKLIVSDEVYYNESFENEEFHSFGHLTTEEQPVVLIGGMEKTFLVPGWQLSWIIFFDKSGKLSAVRDAFANTVSLFNPPASFLQAALPQILDTLTPNFTKKMMPLFEANYHYLFAEFAKLSGLQPTPGQGTFYLSVLIDLKDKFRKFKNDLEFLQVLLDEENIWILSLSCFGGGVNGFRMMTAAPREYYADLFPRLSAFCARHAQQ